MADLALSVDVAAIGGKRRSSQGMNVPLAAIGGLSAMPSKGGCENPKSKKAHCATKKITSYKVL